MGRGFSSVFTCSTDKLPYSAMGREEERKKEFLAIGPFFDVKPDECPCCHGRHIVRYAHASSNGRGRYLCKDCHKTFCG